MKTLYTIVSNFIELHPIWSALIAVIALFWVVVGVCWIYDKEALIQEWDECWRD